MRISIFDCPTRGIDVGVQSDIYDLLERLRKKKKAILMISEELPEVIGMSDRILIPKDGSLTAEIGRSKKYDRKYIDSLYYLRGCGHEK